MFTPRSSTTKTTTATAPHSCKPAVTQPPVTRRWTMLPKRDIQPASVVAAAAKKQRDAKKKPTSLCTPELRDPLTISLGYMHNPSAFRACNQFTLSCWDNAIYLEAEMSCPYVSKVEASTGSGDAENVISTSSITGFPIPPSNFNGLLNKLNAVQKLYWVGDCSATFAPASMLSFANLGGAVVARNTRLTAISQRLFFGCTYLRDVVIEDLPELQSISDDCVAMCGRLETARIQNLPNLTFIGNNFLSCCSNLRHVTIAQLPKLQCIADSFLRNVWVGLKTFDLKNLPLLTAIGNDFLAECSSLEHVTFENLPNLLNVGKGLLNRCKSLQQFSLTNLPALARVGNSFLANCESLTQVKFVDLPQLQVVGHWWMSTCTSLVSVVFDNLPKLRTIGNYFLAGSRSLVEFNFGGLPALLSVGSDWLSECTSLKAVVIYDLPLLYKVGDNWMFRCPSLSKVELKHLPAQVHRRANE